MQVDFNIDDYLRQYIGERIYYFSNPGNGGDCVISAATHVLFKKIGLNYVTISKFDHDLSGCTIIYSGGGNLVNPRTFSARFLKKNHKIAKKIVILPHTIKNVNELLAEFGDNVDIICREKTSFEYVKSRVTVANVFLSHDMAFSLDANQLLNMNDIVRPRLYRYVIDRYLSGKGVVSWRSHIKALTLKKRLRCLDKATMGSDELYCFRIDGESMGFSLPEDNIDLSLLFDFGTATPEISLYTAHIIFSCLNKYKTIHTDRLHMAISGALLGLNVNFYSNNYYKCQAVYEYSIKNKYNNVSWVGQSIGDFAHLK